MPTMAAFITDAGIIAPSYSDVLAQVRNLYLSIFGTDANLDPDTQDGQFLAALAQAIYDDNQTSVAVYNAFSPATAQGAGLSSVVKINGLTRQIATNSQAVVTIGGVAGTQITNGLIGDNLGLNTQWSLPALVTIPDAGTIDVTATCTELGDFSAAAASLTQILTPTRGWQSVTNALQATPGNPVETDAQLRRRQALSTSLNAISVIESIYAAVAAVAGVIRLQVYENDTDATDANGIPSHSICVVVEGGDVMTIAETIALKKTPGTGTFGDVAELVIDSRGVPATIKQQPLALIPLLVEITIQPKVGYTSAIGDEIKAAVVAYFASFPIGETSYLARLYGPAGLGGIGNGETFVVTALAQSRKPAAVAPANVVIDFDELATLLVDDINLVVVP